MITSPRGGRPLTRTSATHACFTPCGEPMRRFLVNVSTVALAFAAIFANPASAQRVLGIGDDALVLPRGRVPLSDHRATGRGSTSVTERTHRDVPTAPSSHSASTSLSTRSESSSFPTLTALQAGVQQLIGNPNWRPTLGNTVVNLRDHVSAFPFVFEAGLSKRFSVGIQVPYVSHTLGCILQRQHQLEFREISGSIRRLRLRQRRTQNATVHTQFIDRGCDSRRFDRLPARRILPRRRHVPRSLANQANAQALIANSRAFAGGAVGRGRPSMRGRFTRPLRSFRSSAPTHSSAIEARVQAFRALYTAAFGANSIAITAIGPFASQNRLTVRDAQTILTDPAFGICRRSARIDQHIRTSATSTLAASSPYSIPSAAAPQRECHHRGSISAPPSE